ncbi:hypothetical protein CGI24_07360 [Vibrio parahaemolyticus]|nr:hypothetical protein [Vibrio parahaemolyticus]TOK27216.1 hypothetical protein CGI24_07360 [Vibrio parahaemolyticus]
MLHSIGDHIMKNLITIIMGLALTACGGGGGGGDKSGDSSTPPPTQTTIVVEEPSMQTLNVPDGYDYDPIVARALSVDISGYSSQRAHLSVYKEYQETTSGTYQAKYASKVASEALINGKAEMNFPVSDSQGNLLVEVWFYDGLDPVQHVISAEDSSWRL